MAVLQIADSDDGQSKMDIVSIPEGFSFQVDSDACGYTSVIVNHFDAAEIVAFIQANT